MDLKMLCKQGSLQIENDEVRVVAPFHRVVWSVPRAKITDMTARPGTIGAVDVTFHTANGNFQAETITRPNFEKLRQYLNIDVTTADKASKPATGKEWYHQTDKVTHTAQYSDQKKMAREIEAAVQYGWTPQTSSAMAGQSSIGKAIAGSIIAGPLGAMVGGKKSKDTITVIFVRRPNP